MSERSSVLTVQVIAPTPRPAPSFTCTAKPWPLAGFTGTSLWIDWERDLYIALLANRVFPASDDPFVAGWGAARVGAFLPHGMRGTLLLEQATPPHLLEAIAVQGTWLDREDVSRWLDGYVRGADGRPRVPDLPLAVSAAHCGGLTLGVAGMGPLGCDLERVAPRPASLWRDLLGADGHRLAGQIAREAGEDVDASATRVWSARECLRKAGLPHDAPLVIRSAAPDGWVVLSCGALLIPTCVLRVRGGDSVAAAVLAGQADEAPVPSAGVAELAAQGAD